MGELFGAKIHITGIVQGVGFRPFVFNLAKRHNLTGWVRNTSAGVDIEVNGIQQELNEFINSLRSESPPLAMIDQFNVMPISIKDFSSFEIYQSESIPDAFQPISPDVSICPDCLRELFDPSDRRFLYSFINCTNCGPRFTIITDIPYDRPNTTMSGFIMCNDCSTEYNDPQNRRFHAQPIACPVCGPQIWLETKNNKNPALIDSSEDRVFLQARQKNTILNTQQRLSQGKIVAIKGLGGFHLACDALNHDAVIELRNRKLRIDKPFALMMASIEEIKIHCFIDKYEQALLESHERPIVILKRRPTSIISPSVAPNQSTLGVMLPYSPLHYLLLDKDYQERCSEHEKTTKFTPSTVLVMTSGNLSEEPIASINEEAHQRLDSIADAFLMHNRPIRSRCDDSVVRIFRNTKKIPQTDPENGRQALSYNYPLRRSRGYAPFPIHLLWNSEPILATGPELKNTFCLTRGSYAFLSHHIGDLENYETLQSFEDSICHYERLFRIKPVAIAYDLHPNYLASRYALERCENDGLIPIGVQHHHAHIAACMAENGLTENAKVIGIAFDGTGYGTDGHIWGGEFFLASYGDYKRILHLEYVPLPGGDAAVRKPARSALAYLKNAGLEWDSDYLPVSALSNEEIAAIRSQLEKRINCPLTSSMGRLFDAAAALIGIRQKVNYEAQAAIELESIADPDEKGSYHFGYDLNTHNSELESCNTIIVAPVIRQIMDDYQNNIDKSRISARFHNAVVELVINACNIIRSKYGITEVALSGGVWQNIILLENAHKQLTKRGFRVYIHHQVPANDGGVSLGQVVIGHYNLINDKLIS